VTAGDDLAWLDGSGGVRLLAEIVATVDLERSLAAVGGDGALAATVADDALLGARVVLVPDGPRTLALAEPSTEGRLAASLARAGEGLAGRYLAAPVELETVRRLAADAGVAVSRPGTGPYGPQLLVLTGPAAGPHVLLVDPRTVPSRR
jgi:hypothetical protein